MSVEKCTPKRRAEKSSGYVQPNTAAQVFQPRMTKTQIKKGLVHVHSKEFTQRQEETLVRRGMGNASSGSRVAVDMTQWCGDEDEVINGQDARDCKSVGVRTTYSATPSIHPSVRSTYSMACSETTIGAGDNTGYWDFQHRSVKIKDLGHTCRECKGKFSRIGEPLTERRGARTSMRYHAECFSGFADPRSQASSSMHMGALAGTQLDAAPLNKAGNKMRTGSHFTGKGDHRHAVDSASSGNKISAFMGDTSSGYGAKSSKGKLAPEPAGAAETGGLSVAQLHEHNQRMALAAIPAHTTMRQEQGIG